VSEERPHYVQHVVANGGVAIGGIDGTIYVEGRPADPLLFGGRQPSPSAAVTSEAPIVALLRWLATPARLGARRLHGSATATAAVVGDFTAQAGEAGWRVVTPVRGGGACDGKLDTFVGVLAVVPDADESDLHPVTWLLSNGLLHQVGRRTRVLLTGDVLDRWTEVRGALANHEAWTDLQRLDTHE
jgi:hypothetical protein